MKHCIYIFTCLFFLFLHNQIVFAESGEDISSVISDNSSSNEMNQAENIVSCDVSPQEVAENSEFKLVDLSDHKPVISPWPLNYTIKASLVTSAGTLICELFAGSHPMTVLNFISLSTGKPAWSDAKGNKHHEPYYHDLPFSSRVKGAYVTSSLRSEGTDFVVQDERCKSHQPVAGSIAMVQNHPGMSSAQFMLMPRNNPKFVNMYTIFGQCSPIEIIDKLTREDATLERIDILSK